jgi:hypothetical protein
MARYLSVIVIVALVVTAPSSAATPLDGNCGTNNYCAPIFPDGLNGFSYYVGFPDNSISPELSPNGKNELINAAGEAKNQWNYQFSSRGSSSRVTYDTNGVLLWPTNGLSGDSASAPSGEIRMAPNFGRLQSEGGFWFSHKLYVIMHEMGHHIGGTGSGVNDPTTTCNSSSIMSEQRDYNNRFFTQCDMDTLTILIGPQRFDDDDDGYWDPPDDCDDGDEFAFPGGSTECTEDYLRESDRDCSYVVDSFEYGACPYSPVLIDLDGDGFELTDRAGGVQFDLDADGTMGQVPWTAQGADDAWLVLDRNGNGQIDDGMELFGNFTVQPASSVLNGFAALAVFDAANEGGNGDGWIDVDDSVFRELRLWRDDNHNGRSEADELMPLESVTVRRLSLEYRSAMRTDSFGNWFRFHARVVGAPGRAVGPEAVDVFLGAQLPRPSSVRSGRGRGGR